MCLGPFVKINAEAVNEELGEMFRTMHKLTKVFIDSGPRTVAERLRNKMEKFKANLPLLNVICNPGIRERHWEEVGNSVIIIDSFYSRSSTIYCRYFLIFFTFYDMFNTLQSIKYHAHFFEKLCNDPQTSNAT